jgi:hypothetical protein
MDTGQVLYPVGQKRNEDVNQDSQESQLNDCFLDMLKTVNLLSVIQHYLTTSVDRRWVGDELKLNAINPVDSEYKTLSCERLLTRQHRE